jgi:Protein ENHANCED DISEASE RESISTANCE 2, C-terminal
MPQYITSYNAKPVLIRRTGTIFKGPNYLEMDIHVHKFANIAKQSIHVLTSRCALMAMQIGFVIEGREDSELPETLFACVAVNKPQEDMAEFLFEDDWSTLWSSGRVINSFIHSLIDGWQVNALEKWMNESRTGKAERKEKKERKVMRW